MVMVMVMVTVTVTVTVTVMVMVMVMVIVVITIIIIIGLYIISTDCRSRGKVSHFMGDSSLKNSLSWAFKPFQ